MKKQSEMNGTNFLNAQKNSQFKDMVRRLFKNKAAVAGLFFFNLPDPHGYFCGCAFRL